MLVTVLIYLFTALVYLITAMLPIFFAVHQIWELVKGQICSVSFGCFAWENYDKSIGLEPNLVFGPCIVAFPALWEPSHEDNEQLHIFPFLFQKPIGGWKKNGTFLFFSCGVDVFSLFTITLQHLEYPRGTKIFLLACFKYIFPAFSKVNSRISCRGMSQGSMVMGSKWENMGRWQGLSPPTVQDFTTEQVQDLEVIKHLKKKGCPDYGRNIT